MKRLVPALLFLICASSSCRQNEIVEITTTTFEEPWQAVSYTVPEGEAGGEVIIDISRHRQIVSGFGTCFNELGWLSLSALDEKDRTSIMNELFRPGTGANFSYGRMPMGANDFSTDFYSYDETDGDFELKDFSIDRDRQTLIPFIKEALDINPELRIWATPWCPPQWMKVNRNYASKPSSINPMTEEQRMHEGEDSFIMEPEYLSCYARYFGKFLDAYKAEGINIYMVMPQNEPNSDQNFPSCTWTYESLGEFIKYLGPETSSRAVKLYLGTMERPDPSKWEVILRDRECMKYIEGMGFQWAGKDAIPSLSRKYAKLQCFQTEQECGDGRNDWEGAMHSWDLMKHYLSSGANAYMYWNTSLFNDGESHWGWKQNSLVVVDAAERTYSFTPEYYILKHASHFVNPGANVIALSGSFKEALAFSNTDGTVVLLAANKEDSDTVIEVAIANKRHKVLLKANSLSTIVFK